MISIGVVLTALVLVVRFVVGTQAGEPPLHSFEQNRVLAVLLIVLPAGLSAVTFSRIARSTQGGVRPAVGAAITFLATEVLVVAVAFAFLVGRTP